MMNEKKARSERDASEVIIDNDEMRVKIYSLKGLCDDIQSVIDSYSDNHQITVLDIVGALELVKHECLKQQ